MEGARHQRRVRDSAQSELSYRQKSRFSWRNISGGSYDFYKRQCDGGNQKNVSAFNIHLNR